MTTKTSNTLIIKGLTHSGATFRPSDWAERLCGMLSAFGADQHLQYSPFVRPATIDNIKCVLLDTALEEIEPRALRFFLGFAKDNELQVMPLEAIDMVSGDLTGGALFTQPSEMKTGASSETKRPESLSYSEKLAKKLSAS
jgi:Protein of unknown function (DUF3579)